MHRKFRSWALIALLTPLSWSSAQVTAVVADKVLTGVGSTSSGVTRIPREIDNGVILIREGKILRVGQDLPIPEGARVLKHAGVVTPGWIDLAVSFGASDLAETIEGLSPKVHAAEGLNPWDPAFEIWRRAGITTVHVLPPARNTVSGTGAVWKTGGPLQTRELLRRASLRISLTSASRRRDRAPTSLMGALAALRELLAREGEYEAIDRARRRQMTVWIDVDSKVELRGALGLLRDNTLDARILGSRYPGEILAMVEKARVPLVLSRLSFDQTQRVMRAYGALGATTHPLGFFSNSAGTERPSLRLAAALAVRQGLDPQVALRALTGGAAELLGIEGRVGTIEPGKDADMVWFSGDPLDLGSKVAAVFIGGERVDTGNLETE